MLYMPSPRATGVQKRLHLVFCFELLTIEIGWVPLNQHISDIK